MIAVEGGLLFPRPFENKVPQLFLGDGAEGRDKAQDEETHFSPFELG